jgi:hypothetical protein
MSAVIGFTNIARKRLALRQSRCLAAFESEMTCLRDVSGPGISLAFLAPKLVRAADPGRLYSVLRPAPGTGLQSPETGSQN